MTNINEKTLEACGLSNEQIKIYDYLLEHGFSAAKTIASETTIGRALTYKVLDQLIDLGLVEKNDSIGKISQFSPTHPQHIQAILDQKKQSLMEAENNFDYHFNDLVSRFNLQATKPKIDFFDGQGGLKLLYEKILASKADAICVLGWINGHGQAEAQRKLLERRIQINIPEARLKTTSQIIIFNDCVAITTFKNGITTTFLENREIANLFRLMIKYIWDHS